MTFFPMVTITISRKSARSMTPKPLSTHLAFVFRIAGYGASINHLGSGTLMPWETFDASQSTEFLFPSQRIELFLRLLADQGKI